MKKEDVKVGMLIKANSELNGIAGGYVRPNDIGEVVYISDVSAKVEWRNSIEKYNDSCWWIDYSDFEPYEEIKKENKMEEKKITSKLSVPVSVKVDMLFDSPIEEMHKDGKFIFYGRMVMFISNNGEHGYAMCSPNDLSHYNKEIGEALSMWRAYNK